MWTILGSFGGVLMPCVPGFLPSQNAPLFHNSPWPPGTSLGVSIYGLPPVNLNVTKMGLCGGMSFLTRDIFETGTPQLRGRDSTKIPLALAELLVGRLVQSFDGPGTVIRWLPTSGARWYLRPNNSRWRSNTVLVYSQS